MDSPLSLCFVATHINTSTSCPLYTLFGDLYPQTMSQQPKPLDYLSPPTRTEIPGLPLLRRASAGSTQIPDSIPTETRAAMMTWIDDHNDKVAGLKQGDLLYAWAEEHKYNAEECAEVVRSYREQTRQAAETRRLESMAASAAANETAYTPATSVKPIPFIVTPDNSGRTIPTTNESTFTGRSPPPHRMTGASHTAVPIVRKSTREPRSPRHTRWSSPEPSRSASPSNELMLVKRPGSHTAKVVSRPSSPIPTSAPPSKQSRHVSWASSPEPATVVKSKTTVFDPKNGSATIIKRERTERPPASSSHTDKRRNQSTSHPGSVASKSKGHTHLTQRIDSKGKKQTHIHF